MKNDKIFGCEIKIHNEREDLYVRIMKREFEICERCYRKERSLNLRAAFGEGKMYGRLEGYFWCLYFLDMVVDKDDFSPYEKLHELMDMWDRMDGITGGDKNVDKAV